MQKHNSQYYLICIFGCLFTTAIQNGLTNYVFGAIPNEMHKALYFRYHTSVFLAKCQFSRI
jgi:hypothetical protein